MAPAPPARAVAIPNRLHHPARQLLALGFGLGPTYESLPRLAEPFQLRQLGWIMPPGVSFGLLILLGLLTRVFLISGFIRCRCSDSTAANRYLRICAVIASATVTAFTAESA